MTEICVPKNPCSMPKMSFHFSRGAQALTVVALSLTAGFVGSHLIGYPAETDSLLRNMYHIFSAGNTATMAAWGLFSSDAFVPFGASVKKAAAIISTCCIIGGGVGFGLIQTVTHPKETLDFLSGSEKVPERPKATTDGKKYACLPYTNGKLLCE